VDVWSAGCILAELASRRVLFQGETPINVLSRIFDVIGCVMMGKGLIVRVGPRHVEVQERLKVW
jgi:hypothetical protein